MGTVFKLDAAGARTTLHSFDSQTEGYPPSGLIQAIDGNFYGTASSGGAGGQGTLFKIDATGTLTQIHSFTCDPGDPRAADGCIPEYGVIQAGGDLYGTTSFGAIRGGGTVFRMIAGTLLTTLHRFDCATEGCQPRTGVLQGSRGEFYGTAKLGPTGGGTLYKMDATGATTTLHAFACGTDGCAPNGGLVQAGDGNLYGTNLFGGGGNPGAGTIFKADAAGEFSVLHFFDCTTDAGCQPFAGLLLASDGYFYGTTERGGATDGGAVFKMDAAGAVTTVHSFDCRADGCRSTSRLIEGSDGYLYGTTSSGGPLGGGVVFRLNAGSGQASPANAMTSPACLEVPGPLLRANPLRSE